MCWTAILLCWKCLHQNKLVLHLLISRNLDFFFNFFSWRPLHENLCMRIHAECHSYKTYFPESQLVILWSMMKIGMHWLFIVYTQSLPVLIPNFHGLWVGCIVVAFVIFLGNPNQFMHLCWSWSIQLGSHDLCNLPQSTTSTTVKTSTTEAVSQHLPQKLWLSLLVPVTTSCHSFHHRTPTSTTEHASTLLTSRYKAQCFDRPSHMPTVR